MRYLMKFPTTRTRKKLTGEVYLFVCTWRFSSWDGYRQHRTQRVAQGIIIFIIFIILLIPFKLLWFLLVICAQINPGHVGFYHTSYAPYLLKQLVIAAGSTATATTRPLGSGGWCVFPYFFVQAGNASMVEVLELLEAFANEGRYSVLTHVCSALGILSTVLAYKDHHDQRKGSYFFIINSNRLVLYVICFW